MVRLDARKEDIEKTRSSDRVLPFFELCFFINDDIFTL